MDITQWYRETVKDDSENAAAIKAGISQRTLNRQLRTGTLSPEVVVAIADAYGRGAIEALIISGLITQEHVRKHGVKAALEKATNEELRDMIWERMESAPDSGTAFDEW